LHKNNDILIIPDGHAHPQYDNDRFSALGEYILKHKPSVVVCIGDLGDFPSLSSYDEGTRNAWGRLYRADCDATIDAQRRIWGPVDAYNERRAKSKKSQYRPRRIFCTGNHEDRADRFVNAHPAMDGFIQWREDIQLDRYWTEFVDFKAEITVNGISFSHYFAGGLTGQPISGVNIARSMAMKLSRSAVQGHSHVMSYNYTDRGPDQARIECWSCGCFSHPEQVEGWNRNTTSMWRYGILHLRGVEDGEATEGWQWVEQKHLMKS
jgi:hypothetical protein